MIAQSTARQSANASDRVPLTLLGDGSPACPACGGRMWDNRATKKNPKAPDFKCRSRECDGRVWPGQFKTTTQPSGAEQGSSSVTSAPTAHVPQTAAPERQSLRACYLGVTEFVLNNVRPKYDGAGLPCTDSTVAAIVATLFIAACRGGEG